MLQGHAATSVASTGRELADGIVGEVRALWRPDQVLRRGREGRH